MQLLADLLDEGDGVSQRLLDIILDFALMTDDDNAPASRLGTVGSRRCALPTPV